MSSGKRSWTSGYQAACFWTGLGMTLACIGLVLAGNTEPINRFEHADLPLSWACAGLAILLFTAAEICHHAGAVKRRSTKQSEDLSAARGPVEARNRA